MSDVRVRQRHRTASLVLVLFEPRRVRTHTQVDAYLSAALGE